MAANEQNPYLPLPPPQPPAVPGLNLPQPQPFVQQPIRVPVPQLTPQAPPAAVQQAMAGPPQFPKAPIIAPPAAAQNTMGKALANSLIQQMAYTSGLTMSPWEKSYYEEMSRLQAVNDAQRQGIRPTPLSQQSADAVAQRDIAIANAKAAAGYGPKAAQTADQRAQAWLEQENARRALEGLPPIEVANQQKAAASQAAQDKKTAASQAAADKAQQAWLKAPEATTEGNAANATKWLQAAYPGFSQDQINQAVQAGEDSGLGGVGYWNAVKAAAADLYGQIHTPGAGTTPTTPATTGQVTDQSTTNTWGLPASATAGMAPEGTSAMVTPAGPDAAAQLTTQTASPAVTPTALPSTDAAINAMNNAIAGDTATPTPTDTGTSGDQTDPNANPITQTNTDQVMGAVQGLTGLATPYAQSGLPEGRSAATPTDLTAQQAQAVGVGQGAGLGTSAVGSDLPAVGLTDLGSTIAGIYNNAATTAGVDASNLIGGALKTGGAALNAGQTGMTAGSILAGLAKGGEAMGPGALTGGLLLGGAGAVGSLLPKGNIVTGGVNALSAAPNASFNWLWDNIDLPMRGGATIFARNLPGLLMNPDTAKVLTDPQQYRQAFLQKHPYDDTAWWGSTSPDDVNAWIERNRQQITGTGQGGLNASPYLLSETTPLPSLDTQDPLVNISAKMPQVSLDNGKPSVSAELPTVGGALSQDYQRLRDWSQQQYQNEPEPLQIEQSLYSPVFEAAGQGQEALVGKIHGGMEGALSRAANKYDILSKGKIPEINQFVEKYANAPVVGKALQLALRGERSFAAEDRRQSANQLADLTKREQEAEYAQANGHGLPTARENTPEGIATQKAAVAQRMAKASGAYTPQEIADRLRPDQEIRDQVQQGINITDRKSVDEGLADIEKSLLDSEQASRQRMDRAAQEALDAGYGKRGPAWQAGYRENQLLRAQTAQATKIAGEVLKENATKAGLWTPEDDAQLALFQKKQIALADTWDTINQQVDQMNQTLHEQKIHDPRQWTLLRGEIVHENIDKYNAAALKMEHDITQLRRAARGLPPEAEGAAGPTTPTAPSPEPGAETPPPASGETAPPPAEGTPSEATPAEATAAPEAAAETPAPTEATANEPATAAAETPPTDTTNLTNLTNPKSGKPLTEAEQGLLAKAQTLAADPKKKRQVTSMLRNHFGITTPEQVQAFLKGETGMFSKAGETPATAPASEPEPAEPTATMPATRRMYHGSSASFTNVDPTKLDPNGLFGPGHYLTSDPHVASSYATMSDQSPALLKAKKLQADLDEIDQEIESLRSGPLSKAEGLDVQRALTQNLADRQKIVEQLNALGEGSGPNVRAVNVPTNLNLLDAEAPVGRDAIAQVEQVLGERLSGVYPDSSGEKLWKAVRDAMPMKGGNLAAQTNDVLHRAGYDGISYAGGKRIPMKDAGGNPIEHDVSMVFPQSVGKLTNALSGQPEWNRISLALEKAGIAKHLGGPQVLTRLKQARAIPANVTKAIEGLGQMLADGKELPAQVPKALTEFFQKEGYTPQRIADVTARGTKQAIDEALSIGHVKLTKATAEAAAAKAEKKTMGKLAPQTRAQRVATQGKTSTRLAQIEKDLPKVQGYLDKAVQKLSEGIKSGEPFDRRATVEKVATFQKMIKDYQEEATTLRAFQAKGPVDEATVADAVARVHAANAAAEPVIGKDGSLVMSEAGTAAIKDLLKAAGTDSAEADQFFNDLFGPEDGKKVKDTIASVVPLDEALGTTTNDSVGITLNSILNRMRDTASQQPTLNELEASKALPSEVVAAIKTTDTLLRDGKDVPPEVTKTLTDYLKSKNYPDQQIQDLQDRGLLANEVFDQGSQLHAEWQKSGVGMAQGGQGQGLSPAEEKAQQLVNTLQRHWFEQIFANPMFAVHVIGNIAAVAAAHDVHPILGSEADRIANLSAAMPADVTQELGATHYFSRGQGSGSAHRQSAQFVEDLLGGLASRLTGGRLKRPLPVGVDNLAEARKIIGLPTERDRLGQGTPTVPAKPTLLTKMRDTLQKASDRPFSKAVGGAIETMPHVVGGVERAYKVSAWHKFYGEGFQPAFDKFASPELKTAWAEISRPEDGVGAKAKAVVDEFLPRVMGPKSIDAVFSEAAKVASTDAERNALTAWKDRATAKFQDLTSEERQSFDRVQGITNQLADEQIHQIFFDRTNYSRAEQALRHLFPFLTYDLRMPGQWAQATVKKPQIYNTLLQTQNAAAEENQKDLVPQRLQGGFVTNVPGIGPASVRPFVGFGPEKFLLRNPVATQQEGTGGITRAAEQALTPNPLLQLGVNAARHYLLGEHPTQGSVFPASDLIQAMTLAAMPSHSVDLEAWLRELVSGDPTNPYPEMEARRQLADMGIEPRYATEAQKNQAKSRAGAALIIEQALQGRVKPTTHGELERLPAIARGLGLDPSKATPDDVWNKWAALPNLEKEQIRQKDPWLDAWWGLNEVFLPKAERVRRETLRGYLDESKKLRTDQTAEEQQIDQKYGQAIQQGDSTAGRDWVKAHHDILVGYKKARQKLQEQAPYKNVLGTKYNPTNPLDKAVDQYFTISPNNKEYQNEDGTVNYEAWAADRRKFMDSLDPQTRQYVTQYEQRNDSPLEIQYYQALDDLDRLNATVPKYQGMTLADMAKYNEQRKAAARGRALLASHQNDPRAVRQAMTTALYRFEYQNPYTRNVDPRTHKQLQINPQWAAFVQQHPELGKFGLVNLPQGSAATGNPFAPKKKSWNFNSYNPPIVNATMQPAAPPQGQQMPQGVVPQAPPQVPVGAGQ